MPLPFENTQIPLPLQPLMPLPLQTPSRHLDIGPDILHQTLLAQVIVFRPNEAADEEVHARGVEGAREGVEDVYFLFWLTGEG